MRAWIVGGACLGVAATAFGGLIASGAGDDPSADRIPTATEIPAATSEPDRVYFVTPGPPPGDPRPLTAQECTEARPRMEAQVNLRRPKIAALGSAELALPSPTAAPGSTLAVRHTRRSAITPGLTALALKSS